MAGFVPYFKFKLDQLKGNGTAVVDFDDDNLKVALVTSSYVPNMASDTFWSDIVANQVSGSGYTVGGTALTTKAVTLNTTTGVVTFTADSPVTWGVNAAGFSNARYAILYKDTGTAASSVVIGVLDLGQAYGNTAGDFSLRWDATNGIMQLS